MKKLNLIIKIIILSFISITCRDYVTNVEPLVTATEDSNLNNQSQVQFLINGVETNFAYTLGQVDVCAGGLSDAFFFDNNVPAATYPTFEDIDLGNIHLANASVADAYNSVGQLRYYSDDLIRRIDLISFSDTTLKNSALFTGYFFGGYARYLYATYFGLNPTQGGSPINNGPFIESNDMYNLAINDFKESLKYINDALMIKTVNSMLAKSYLYKADYDSAASYAAQGLINGDTPFQAFHNSNQLNYWYGDAGQGRKQFVADFRFINYIDADPNEAGRIKIGSIMGNNNVMYYYQLVYPNLDSPQKVITWQENDLMRAELILRGAASGDALGLVNEVRVSHGIAPLSSVDLDIIYIERDKELFASGNRLADERRFNKWHLAPGTWQYLPVTERERNGNPNID